MMEETALYSDLERALAKFTRHAYVVRNSRGMIFDTDIAVDGDTIIFDRAKFEYGDAF